MALYPDVPKWLRINNGNCDAETNEENAQYYRVHREELLQEIREIQELEATGEIPTDTITTTHEYNRWRHGVQTRKSRKERRIYARED